MNEIHAGVKPAGAIPGQQLQFRGYTFLGATQSLCPECLALVPAKIVERNGRVYFRKRCPTHGPREDYVCSDVHWFDRTDYSLPGKVPELFGTAPDRGCPYDCGLCSEHEQHTCIGLVEINSACNLECPMCFAGSGPGGDHLSVQDCQRAIDRLVEVEGRPEIVQLSGGEPTIHPQFMEVCRYACDQPIDIVMINTNGIRLAHDRRLVEQLAELRHRIEIYLQMDGFNDDGCRTLRGESLVETKLRRSSGWAKPVFGRFWFVRCNRMPMIRKWGDWCSSEASAVGLQASASSPRRIAAGLYCPTNWSVVSRFPT